MIETQADARRLTSIDAATSLGRMADDVVLAVLHRLDQEGLDSHDEQALTNAAEWLDRLAGHLADPLDLARLGDDVSAVPGLFGFGPDVAGTAIDAIGAGSGTDTEIAAIRELRSRVLEVFAGSARRADMERLLQVFESIARAMLSAAGSMLSPPARTSWAMTFAS